MDHCRTGRMDGRCRVQAKRIFLLVAFSILAGLTFEAAVSKTPGKTFCFLGTCHRVKTIPEMQALVGKTVTLHASHYDDPKRDRYNPSNITSSGEFFRWDRPDNAASPIYPDGTTLLLWNPATRQSAVVRINNAGPYWGKRNLDVSRTTAEKLGFGRQGVATLRAKILSAPTRVEATYRRGRTYPPVQGHIGQFASLELAALAIGRGRIAPPPSLNYAAAAVVAAGREPVSPPIGALESTPAAAAVAGLPVPEVEATPVPAPVAVAAAAVPATKKSLLKVAKARRVEAKRAQARKQSNRVATAAARTKASVRAAQVAAASRVSQVRVALARVSPGRAAAIRDGRPGPVARAGQQQLADARRPRLSDGTGRRQRLAEAAVRRPQTTATRCRPGFALRMRESDGGQVRVVCVSTAEDEVRGSRSARPSSPERSFRVASARNRS